jgi:hypothetical protein
MYVPARIVVVDRLLDDRERPRGHWSRDTLRLYCLFHVNGMDCVWRKKRKISALLPITLHGPATFYTRGGDPNLIHGFYMKLISPKIWSAKRYEELMRDICLCW